LNYTRLFCSGKILAQVKTKVNPNHRTMNNFDYE